MPRWEDVEQRDGTTVSQLDGARAGVRVHPMPAEGATLVYVALAVDGTDAATIELCKRRAERLLAEALR